jgi:hypothetical protein
MTKIIAQHYRDERLAIVEPRVGTRGKIEIILIMLAARFGKVPASIQKKIKELQDESRLEEMMNLSASATCQSLTEFQEAL